MKKKYLSVLLLMTLVILMAGLFSVSTGVAAENVNVTVYLENGEDAYGETATVTIAGNTYTGTVSRSYSWGSYDYYVSLYNVTASRGDAVTVVFGPEVEETPDPNDPHATATPSPSPTPGE